MLPRQRSPSSSYRSGVGGLGGSSSSRRPSSSSPSTTPRSRGGATPLRPPRSQQQQQQASSSSTPNSIYPTYVAATGDTAYSTTAASDYAESRGGGFALPTAFKSSEDGLVDTRADDVDYVKYMHPMHLSATEQLLNALPNASTPAIQLGRPELTTLLSETTDFINGIDSRLQSLFARDNETVAQRLLRGGGEDSIGVAKAPQLLTFFELQRRTNELSGVAARVTPQMEQQTLALVADAVE